MPTPDEIQLKTFSVTLRGFDQTEVTRFLQDVAAQLQSTLELVDEAEGLMKLAEAEAKALKRRARAEAKAIVANATAEAEALTRVAERTREEAVRIRADALGLSERELKQAAQDSDEVRLKAVHEIESILARADAEVSAMLRAFREGHDDLLGIGRHLTAPPRNTRRGSQRQLGQ